MSNPYSPPHSQVENTTSEIELASRWSRLGAALVDGLIGLAVGVPTMIWLGFFDYIADGSKPPYTLTLASSLIGFAAFVILHGRFLKTDGQTIGKKLVGIRIVDLNDQILPLQGVIGKRYLPIVIAGLVPLVGQILTLVDVLFIFGSSKRCLHDYIAGTKVIGVSRV